MIHVEDAYLPAVAPVLPAVQVAEEVAACAKILLMQDAVLVAVPVAPLAPLAAVVEAFVKM